MMTPISQVAAGCSASFFLCGTHWHWHCTARLDFSFVCNSLIATYRPIPRTPPTTTMTPATPGLAHHHDHRFLWGYSFPLNRSFWWFLTVVTQKSSSCFSIRSLTQMTTLFEARARRRGSSSGCQSSSPEWILWICPKEVGAVICLHKPAHVVGRRYAADASPKCGSLALLRNTDLRDGLQRDSGENCHSGQPPRGELSFSRVRERLSGQKATFGGGTSLLLETCLFLCLCYF